MFYAINKETKEHIATNLSERNAGKWPSMKWIVVGVDEDGWIPWNAASGRECPISKDQNYVVKLANGEDIDCTLNRPVIRWDDTPPSSTRVIAYKPILEESREITRTSIMDSYRESQESKETEWDAGHLGYVTIEAEDSNGTTICVKDEYGHIHLCSKTLLKPINHERDSAIKQMSKDINHHTVESLFDDEPYMLAENLYDMGYRKVEGD